MKTPNLNKWLRERHWEIPDVIISPAATSLREAVAEDLRAACEKAWDEGWRQGWDEASWGANRGKTNPYRKATP